MKAKYNKIMLSILTLVGILLSQFNIVNAEGTNEKPGVFWYISVAVIIVLVMVPWIYVIVKFGILRKLRIRFFDQTEEILPAIYLKRGSKIELSTPVKEGYTFDGWFYDPELTEPFIDIVMPDFNMKLYAKFTKN